MLPGWHIVDRLTAHVGCHRGSGHGGEPSLVAQDGTTLTTGKVKGKKKKRDKQNKVGKWNGKKGKEENKIGESVVDESSLSIVSRRVTGKVISIKFKSNNRKVKTLKSA